MAKKPKFKTGITIASDYEDGRSKIVKVKQVVRYDYLLEEKSGERHWVHEEYIKSRIEKER